MGWFLTRSNFEPALGRVRDWQRFPELRLLDRLDSVAPLLAALAMFGLGYGLEQVAPQLATNAWQMLVWGFVVSTIACFHALCHRAVPGPS